MLQSKCVNRVTARLSKFKQETITVCSSTEGRNYFACQNREIRGRRLPNARAFQYVPQPKLYEFKGWIFLRHRQRSPYGAHWKRLACSFNRGSVIVSKVCVWSVSSFFPAWLCLVPGDARVSLSPWRELRAASVSALFTFLNFF